MKKVPKLIQAITIENKDNYCSIEFTDLNKNHLYQIYFINFKHEVLKIIKNEDIKEITIAYDIVDLVFDNTTKIEIKPLYGRFNQGHIKLSKIEQVLND